MDIETSIHKIRGTKVTSPYPVKLTPAEIRLVFSLQRHFPPGQIFPDCFFPRPKTKKQQASENLDLAAPRPYTSTDVVQIDCIAVSQQGIFVFESKDYSGWIFGQGGQYKWTQVLCFGRDKYSLYNPVRQNASHLAALDGLFPLHVPIFSVVVFGRETTLRVKNLPDRCLVLTQDQVVPTLSVLPSTAHLTPDDVNDLAETIQAARLTPTPAMRQNHISEVEEIAE